MELALRGDYIDRGRDGFDPNQPRDDHGRWTDTGAGEGSGSAEANPPRGGDASRNADQLSGAFSSESPSDAEKRRHVAQVFRLDTQGESDAKSLGITPQVFHELTSEGASRFHEAVTYAKIADKNYGSSVHAYPLEDYKGMRLFLSADGKSGFALKGADIVSVFKHIDSDAKGSASLMVALAVQQGGRTLDAFDTVLPTIYQRNGFIAASRLAWDDKEKPPTWEYETYKEFNNGRPDVVFMVYRPDIAFADGRQRPYRKTDGFVAKTYDEAVDYQKKMMRPQDRPPAPPIGMPHEEVQKSIVRVADDLDFDPAMIMISSGQQTFELGGRQRTAAGMAATHRIGKDAVLVTVYSQHVTPESIDGVIAHEIEHIKYQTALNRYRQEFDKVVAEPGKTDDVMYADGRLKPPYDQKYPAYTLMHDALHTHGTIAFATSDGVSDYSYDWWVRWIERGKHGEDARSAMHETLAEMANIKYETGKFPEHMGERLIAWREQITGSEQPPKPTQAQIDKNAKLWRDLYRAVDKVWKLPQ